LSKLSNVSRAQFDAVHADGLDALQSGDFQKLTQAIDRERAILEEQRALINRRSRFEL
jgi:hypothetical protein